MMLQFSQIEGEKFQPMAHYGPHARCYSEHRTIESRLSDGPGHFRPPDRFTFPIF